MILVVGNTPPEYLVEDLNVRVPFRAQVQFTESQYHRSPDLQQAIIQAAVRVIYGVSTPPTVRGAGDPLTAAPPQLLSEGVARGHDPNQALQDLVEVQRAQLEAQQRQIALLSEQASKIDQLSTLLANLQVAGSVVASTPQAAVVAGQPVTREAPVFIPSIRTAEVGESQIQVEQTSGQGVSDSVKALKNKRKS